MYTALMAKWHKHTKYTYCTENVALNKNAYFVFICFIKKNISSEFVCVPQDCPDVLVAGYIFQITLSKSACNPATHVNV